MATPQTFVATTIGRVAIPKLADTLVKTGADKFVKQYGQKAFEAVLGTSIGARAYSKTEEYITEYLNHIDTGGDEESFVPKGSMPTATRSDQMDAVMAVPNKTPFAGDLKVPGVIVPDAGEIERENERFRELEKKRLRGTPPPEIPLTTGETTPPKIETTEKFPIEDKLPDTLSTPIPEPEGPQIYYNKDAELKEGLAEYEEVYSEERFAKANKEYPKYDPANTKKIVEADKHFGAVSLARKYGNDADNVQLIYISPDEYLNLTTEMNPDSDWSNAKIEYLENKIRQGKEIGEIPILFVGRTGEDYNVRGHEGRHRAQAFKNAGYDKIPVRIEGFGKHKENDVENKLYTATKRSYLYNEEWAQEYIGFVPKRIVTERLKNGVFLSGEEAFSINLNSEDFYDVLTKEKLFKTDDVNTQTEDLVRGIGDNNPPSSIEEETTENITQDNFVTKDNVSVTNNLNTQNFLDDKLMDELLVIRGGIKGYNENMSSDFPKMPGATKAKMEIQLQKKLFDKYKINEYPEGETPETVTKERQEYLIHTYNKRLAAIEYVTSVAYDVIGRTDKEAMIVVDEDGLPIAGAKVESKFAGPQTYSKDALTITEMGSVFKNAGDQLFNDIIERAKKENKKFIVAEDLTSEGALQALKDRGFRTTTTKATKKFKGHKIRRPNGRSAVQKNLVLDLSKQITKEQTDNLLKNK